MNKYFTKAATSFLAAGILFIASDEICKDIIESNKYNSDKRPMSSFFENEEKPKFEHKYLFYPAYTHYIKVPSDKEAPEWYSYFGENQDGTYMYYINNKSVSVPQFLQYHYDNNEIELNVFGELFLYGIDIEYDVIEKECGVGEYTLKYECYDENDYPMLEKFHIFKIDYIPSDNGEKFVYHYVNDEPVLVNEYYKDGILINSFLKNEKQDVKKMCFNK